MGPSKKKQLSDTDEALVAIASETGGEIGAQRVLDHIDIPTFNANGLMHELSDSMKELIRLIARDIVSSHERDCAGLERVERRVDDMQKTINVHSDVINQYLGEKKFKRYVQPILIGFVGSAAGVALVGLLLKGLLFHH